MNKMVVKGFIFDIDDTLVDSKEVHYQSWEYVLEKYKISIKKEDVIKEFGNATNKIGLKFANGDIELGNKLANEKTEHLISNINKIQPFSGVNELFKRIIENKCTIAIASSNFRKVIEAIIKINNWDKFISVFVGIEDVANSKPDPEMILKCIKKLNYPPKNCVMIGDSLADIQAGQAAKVKTIGVLSKNKTYEYFEPCKPNIILNSIKDLINYIPLHL